MEQPRILSPDVYAPLGTRSRVLTENTILKRILAEAVSTPVTGTPRMSVLPQHVSQ